MSTTERDELANVIAETYLNNMAAGPLAPKLTNTDLADDIIAAGYWRPRQVTTVEELDALPVGTVLLLPGEGDVIRRHERRWYATGDQWSTFSNDIALPATVLYEASL